MGANAQTSVPTFTAGEILTAANMNISARTGIPVFADETARNNGFGGTGEKVLAEGQYAYLESTNATQVYDGASWVVVGASGLTLISATTIGSAVSSVTVSNAFSATYDNYLITVSGGVASTTVSLNLVLGATATGYYAFDVYGAYTSNTVNGFATANGVRWNVGAGTTNNLDAQIVLKSPFLAKTTGIVADSAIHATTGDNTSVMRGFLNNTTSYTDFTLGRNTGTLTGGTIRVYGLANS